MKCQKCGNNEVNFHYTSNINGSVTEAYLCSECAKDSGFAIGGAFGDAFGGAFSGTLGRTFGGASGRAFSSDAVANSFNPFTSGLRGGLPLRAFMPGGGFIFPAVGHVPGFGFSVMSPEFTAQRISPSRGECGCNNEQNMSAESCGCGDGQCAEKASVVPEQNEKIDKEMLKRRELNAMRELMRVAADNDDFERAMELRDRIKEIEQAEKNKQPNENIQSSDIEQQEGTS